MAEEPEDDQKKPDLEDREEKLKRLRHLMQERGEDAAKMIKSWLHQSMENK